jgi:UDP-N-acetyl-D-galactosamine dehydrogenase
MGDEVKICVIGLGYVGLPLAYEFAKKFAVVGFDNNPKRVEELVKGYDRTDEVSAEKLKASSIVFTSKPELIKGCNFIIVAVPTPVTQSKFPDFQPLVEASKVVGKYLKPNSIVVYESTVHPGATEEICVPVLEEFSGLKCGDGFKIGYSPERINPGDKVNTLTKIKKIVSGMDDPTLDKVAWVYEQIIEAGVFKATSIKVAEAAKIIENTQRDLNIALMNELSIIFDKMGIRTLDVLNAAGTKWNFLKFFPGLVGGHCIGVDPYYLTHKSESLGHTMDIIVAARAINESMASFIGEKVAKFLVKSGRNLNESRVLILGFTFKENVSDIRNTKVIDIYSYLKSEWGLAADIYDPVADHEHAAHEYNIDCVKEPFTQSYDAVILAVSHDVFKTEGVGQILRYLKKDSPSVFIDIKSTFSPKDVPAGVAYWSL